jgi:hypothetical protein
MFTQVEFIEGKMVVVEAVETVGRCPKQSFPQFPQPYD